MCVDLYIIFVKGHALLHFSSDTGKYLRQECFAGRGICINIYKGCKIMAASHTALGMQYKRKEKASASPAADATDVP
jgi:hypothetical protein